MFKHPQWRELKDVQQDIALLHLKSAVTDVKPALLFMCREVPGTLMTFVGRSGSGTGLTGPRREDHRVRAATNRLDKVDDAFLQFRFDRAGDPGVTEFEGISGPGDSGGAAFMEHEGALYVTGVSSWQDTRPTKRVQGVYGVIENYVRVSRHHDWITRTMQSVR